MSKIQVMVKAHKHLGQQIPAKPTDFEVEIVGNKIKIWKGGVEMRSFSIGDTAEYDSYNLSYMGEITGITNKAVTITAYKGSLNEKRHRLDLYKFCWRNHNFDVAKARKSNSEWMD